jgi:aspartate-semialdehyde dehydrogenase
MPLPEDSLRVAIAGAASLRGLDLKAHMEGSGFPAGEVRLFDEEPLAGTLTGVAGEAAFIRSIDEDSFSGLRFVFFAGSPAFAKLHGPGAMRAGATVIDLTGALREAPGAAPWIPRLDALIPPPGTESKAQAAGSVLIAPSTPAIVACSFSSALSQFRPARLLIVFFQPASERDRAGVEELSAQTVKLLSLQAIPEDVFDCQVAFNMLDRWGAHSSEKLADDRAAIGAEIRAYLAGRAPVPAINLIHAPVFYCHTFVAFAEFERPVTESDLSAHLEAAGFQVATAEDPGPSNTGVAGESTPFITAGALDGAVPNGYWFWGAADNHRLAARNAVQIAERILVS